MKKLALLLYAVLLSAPAIGQEMTMAEAIRHARSGSVQALEARQEFISVYWAWRAYQASRLPSLHLYGNLGNFNRSLTLLQSPDDGSMRYVGSFNMQNGMGLQARQNIPFTGGTLTVYTDLNRIDQFGTDARVTWYSQPVTISYQQPLFAYNQFKWDKLIEPKAYETGRKKYVEAMERISLQAVTAWFKLSYGLVQTPEGPADTVYGENQLRLYRENAGCGGRKTAPGDGEPGRVPAAGPAGPQ